MFIFGEVFACLKLITSYVEEWISFSFQVSMGENVFKLANATISK